MHGTGETTSRAIQEAADQGKAPEDLDLSKLLPAAAIHTIADFAVEKIGLGALDKVGADASKSMLLDIFKRVGVTGLKEIPAEEIQSLAERYGANLSLSDASALKEYVNTAAASVAMSVLPGTIGGIRSHVAGGIKEDLNKETPPVDTTVTPATEIPANVHPDVAALLNTIEEPKNVRTKSRDNTTGADLLGGADTTELPEGTRTAKRDRVVGDGNVDGTANIGANEKPAPLAGYEYYEEKDANGKVTNSGYRLKATEAATPTTTPATTTPAKLSPEATSILNLVDNNQKPGGRVEEFRRVAAQNGVLSSPKMSTPEIITALKELQAGTIRPTEFGATEKQEEGQGIKSVRQNAIKYAGWNWDTNTPVTQTNEPSAQNYLHQNHYYGQHAPIKGENAVENLAQEHAFDLLDTVDHDAKDAELKAIVEEKNIGQQAKREAKRVEMQAAGYKPSEIKAAENEIADFNVEDPLKFMSLKELTDLYSKHQKKNIDFKEAGGQQRIKALQDRQAFIATLPQEQQTQVEQLGEQAFTQEVQRDAVRRARTITEKSATGQAIRQTKKAIEKQKEAEQATENEKTAEQLAEEEVTQEFTQQEQATQAKETQRQKTTKPPEITGGKILNRRNAPLIAAVQKNISEKAGLDTILTTLSNERINYSVNARVAQTLINLTKGLGLKVKVVISELPSGKDGRFDPATNTITLKGENGVYTGARHLERVMLHEALHYLTDHVTSNRAKYLKSVKVEDRAAKAAALNRLDRNFRMAKAKLGHKYHIGSLKEFIAEAYSNPNFQMELAKIEERGIGNVLSNLYSSFVKNIAAALGFDRAMYGETLQHSLEDIAAIISVPTRGLKSPTVSFATTKDTTGVKEVSLSEHDPQYAPDKNEAPKTHHYLRTMFTTTPGWHHIGKLFQNDRYEIKVLQDALDMADKLISVGLNEMNNVYTQIVLATGDAKNLYKEYVAEESNKLNKAVNEFGTAMGLDTRGAMEYLHKVLSALHEPERRTTKFVMNVPLENHAAEIRTKILAILNENKLGDDRKVAKDLAIQLRAKLDALVFETDNNGAFIIDHNGDRLINSKNVDSKGSSPIGKNESIDIHSAIYSVTDSAMTQNAVRQITKEYESSEHKAKIDAVIRSIDKLNAVTLKLNRMGNYFSNPVENRINFYGWEHYIPLKGILKPSLADEYLDFHGKHMGSELQEATYSWEGRTTASNDPIIQVMSDATRSAMRASRSNLTQTIKNTLGKSKLNPYGQGIIQGGVIKNVPFEHRDALSEEYKGKNMIFHYNKDGSVDVLQIQDNKKLEAIRRTYKNTNPIIDIMNNITSTLGALHTRYNYNFAPLNFVRDALTNAWTVGAEMGPLEAAKFIKAISAEVATGGIPKAWRISHAFANNDFKRMDALAKTDPHMANMVELIRKGGLVSVMASFSTKTQYEEMNKSMQQSKVSKGWDQINKSLDMWNEMFEIASRSAAYGIKKNSLLAKNIAKGMSNVKGANGEPSPAYQAASIEAAAFTKNLANFEQVGELGKGMGAVYMFFRPSATGAVRAIEAIAPAFPGSLQRALSNLPPHIRNDAEALATFKKNYEAKQGHARIMSASLIAMGGLVYMMSAMTSDDDDLGRNATLNDNMSQWTRFTRFHTKLLGKDMVVQVPWGFGLGSLSASGAQMMAVTMGRQSLKDAMGNMVQISLDSFIPLPVSRMSPTDDPVNFLIDSIMPSFARPIIEFQLNKNGLGQNIYNDSNRRMGDAFTGGDKIPEAYKEASAYFALESNGGIDISPNTLYFLSNSYADGFARVLEEASGVYDIASGNKEFEPKTDIPLFGSFFGAKANIDSIEFSKVENIIKEKERRINMFKDMPEAMAKYNEANPMDEYIVDAYNNSINGELKDLRAQANEYRSPALGLSQKERTELLKVITLEQNVVKRSLLDNFKAYGLEP